MPDLFDAYRNERSTFAEFVGALSPAELATHVPATPGWTIGDVAAHLAGDVAGLLGDDFPGTAIGQFGNVAAITQINDWTDRMVGDRRSVATVDLLEEWRLHTEQLGELLAAGTPPRSAPPFAETVLITDLAVHTHDVYGALGLARDRDGAGVRIATASYVAGLAWWQPKLPALQIATEAKTYTLGRGGDPVTLRVERFELFRALSGRRNIDQLRAYDWDADPEPFLPAFAPYGVRADALVE